MHSSVSGAQAEATCQLFAGLTRRLRSVRCRAGNADSTHLRGAGQVDAWYSFLRHLGVVRCAVVHCVHSELVRHLSGSLLGDHQTARIRCEANAASHDVVRGACVAKRRLHLATSTSNTWKRTSHREYGAGVCGVSEFRLSDLCDAWLILHSAGGDALCLFSDIQGSQADCNGREARPDTTGECHEWWRTRETLGAGRTQQQRCEQWRCTDLGVATSEKTSVSISQRTESVNHSRNHYVSIYCVLAALFYISLSSSISRRESSSTADVVLSISMAGICKFPAKSDYLCNPEQRLSKAFPGNPVLPLFQFELDDARRLLSQSVRRATISARRAWG